MKGWVAGAAGFAFLALQGALAPSSVVSAALDSLVILHTNDTHAWVAPFHGEGRFMVGGAAARAARIRAERDRTGGREPLLLDAGDVFQGTPYFTFFRGVPDFRAMALMDYDVMTLGNHDLDDGPRGLHRAIEAASPARLGVISANVFVAAESVGVGSSDAPPRAFRAKARWIGGGRVPPGAALRFLARPYVEMTRGGIRIAVFGLTTGDLTRIVSPGRNRGVAVADPIGVASALVPSLRDRADVVIALTHMGVEDDRSLAERVPGIDLIVGGHSHTSLESPIRVRNGGTHNGYGGAAIVQAGSRGALLGRTVLYFERTSTRPTRYAGGLIPITPEEGEDVTVGAMLRPYAQYVDSATSDVIYRTSSAISNRGLRDGENALGNFAADVLRARTGADVGFINSGAIRAPIRAGDVTVGSLYSALPFDNEIVVVPMRDFELRRLLDRSARLIGKGGFGQVSGVAFTVYRDRAQGIRVDGKPLEGGRIYRVATVDFLLEGGDGYTLFSKMAAPERTGILLREAAVDFLRTHPGYEFSKQGRIRWEGGNSALRDLRGRG